MKKKIRKQKKYIEIEPEPDSDDTFYFIADYTDGGAPYGVTWGEIISQELYIRPAMKKDAKSASELIHTAIGDIAEQLTGQTKTENICKTMSEFFLLENNRLSYQNMIVADVLGEVAGIIITYTGEDALHLDEPILNRLRKKMRKDRLFFDKETDVGDFYIDTVSVNSKFQGHGIGTRLLVEAERKAIHKNYHRITLNVSRDNPSAKKLYSNLGYQEEKQIQINGHPYDYMVKKV